MKKFFLFAVAVALTSLTGLAQAQTNVTSSAFTVQVSLTPTCNIKTQPGGINFGTYTPFTQTAITQSTNLVFQCSQGLSPTQVALSTSETEASVSAAGTSATASGVLSGLQYTLATNTIAQALTAGTSGTAAAAGANGAAGTNSSAKEYNFAITGTMAANQAGGTGGVASHSYTMTVTY